MGDDSRESLAQQHRLVSARRSGGTREGALLIGRMAWSLSLGIVNCGWLHIYFHFQDQISRILTPYHRNSRLQGTTLKVWGPGFDRSPVLRDEQAHSARPNCAVYCKFHY